MSETLTRSPYRLGEGVAGGVAASRQPVVLSDAEPEDLEPELWRPGRAFADRHPIRSMMIVPLVAFGELLGTLGVMRGASEPPYDEADLEVLEALAERASLAIADARLRLAPSGPGRVPGDLPSQPRRRAVHPSGRRHPGRQPGRMQHPATLRGGDLPARARRSRGRRRPSGQGGRGSARPQRACARRDADDPPRRVHLHRRRVIDHVHHRRRRTSGVRDLPRHHRPGGPARATRIPEPRARTTRHARSLDRTVEPSGVHGRGPAGPGLRRSWSCLTHPALLRPRQPEGSSTIGTDTRRATRRSPGWERPSPTRSAPSTWGRASPATSSSCSSTVRPAPGQVRSWSGSPPRWGPRTGQALPPPSPPASPSDQPGPP